MAERRPRLPPSAGPARAPAGDAPRIALPPVANDNRPPWRIGILLIALATAPALATAAWLMLAH